MAVRWTLRRVVTSHSHGLQIKLCGVSSQVAWHTRARLAWPTWPLRIEFREAHFLNVTPLPLTSAMIDPLEVRPLDRRAPVAMNHARPLQRDF